MFSDLSILDVARAAQSYSGARHAVIAENVANSDTPGYRAADLTPFAAAYRDSGAMRATRAGHADAGAGRVAAARRDSAGPGAASPNGNTVSLEDQMMRAVDATQQYDLALSVYRKSMDLLRMGLGRGR